MGHHLRVGFPLGAGRGQLDRFIHRLCIGIDISEGKIEPLQARIDGLFGEFGLFESVMGDPIMTQGRGTMSLFEPQIGSVVTGESDDLHKVGTLTRDRTVQGESHALLIPRFMPSCEVDDREAMVSMTRLQRFEAVHRPFQVDTRLLVFTEAGTDQTPFHSDARLEKVISGLGLTTEFQRLGQVLLCGLGIIGQLCFSEFEELDFTRIER